MKSKRFIDLEKQIQECSICKKIKPLREFDKSKIFKSGYRNCCKKCRSKNEKKTEKARIRSKKHYEENKKEILILRKKHYEENKEKSLEYQKKRRKNFKEFIFKIKKQIGKCQKCGYKEFYILEFHHKDPSTKLFKISRNVVPFKKALEEIKKCVLWCPNCHRDYHAAIEKQKAFLLENVCQITLLRRKKKKWYNKIKSEIGCKNCGEKNPNVLDAHHRDKENKKENLHRLVHERASNKRILEELEKCDILCANCHQLKHNKKAS